jgi:hypothetical protein
MLRFAKFFQEMKRTVVASMDEYNGPTDAVKTKQCTDNKPRQLHGFIHVPPFDTWIT